MSSRNVVRISVENGGLVGRVGSTCSPLKIGNPKRKLVFQSSIFRGYVEFGTVSCFSRVKVELINSFLMDGQESLLAKMKFLSDVEFRTVDQDERKAVVQEKLYQQWRAGRHRFLPSLGTWDKITLRISSKHNKNMCFSKHFSCFCWRVFYRPTNLITSLKLHTC